MLVDKSGRPMVVVHACSKTEQAALVCSYLRANGIEAETNWEITREIDPIWVGNLGYAYVLVSQDDAETARSLLANPPSLPDGWLDGDHESSHTEDGIAPMAPSADGCAMAALTVPIRVTNWQNQFLPPGEQGQAVECEARVDFDTLHLALPGEQIERLRLTPLDRGKVGRGPRLFGMAEVVVRGRACQVEVLELPRGTQPVLGMAPLQLMDWHLSPDGTRLVPNPESPDAPLWHL